MPRPLPVIVFLALCCGAQPVPAQEQTRFDVVFRGLHVAEVTLVAEERGGTYALAGRVQSTGLARLFARVRFRMQAEGALSAGAPWPRRYAEDVDTGRRVSSVVMGFAEGVPEILAQTPAPGPEAAPPDAAAGSVDPLSALWWVARGGDAPCDWRLSIYDGARRSEITLGPTEGGEAVLTCDGEYRRLAGFPPEDMAEQQSFPFTTRYAARNGAFVLTEVAAMSLLGPIRILRRD
jgi:hypothetical protein